MGDDEADGSGLPPAAPAYDFRTGRPLRGPEDPASPPWRPDGDADELGIWAPDPDAHDEPTAAPYPTAGQYQQPGSYQHPNSYPQQNPYQQTGPQQQPAGYQTPSTQQQPGAFQQSTYQQPASPQPGYQQPGYPPQAYQQPGTYPGQPGPGYPTAEHPPLAPRSTNRAPVVVLVLGVLLAVGALVAVLLLTRGRNTPETPTAASGTATTTQPSAVRSSPGSSATTDASARKAFAGDVDAILQESSAGRRQVTAAINGVRNSCSVAPADADASLTDIIANRQSVLARAHALTTPDAAGEAAKSDLVQALSASLEANQGYQRWLESALASNPGASPAGCPGGVVATDSNYDAATAASTRATAAKQQFVSAYNPIAAEAGLATWTSDQF